MNNFVKTPKVLFICCCFLFVTVANALAGYNFEELDRYLFPESKTISMDFSEAQLTDVLKIFSQQSGMNFIASSEIESETINLYLDQVPVDEALERILSANGYTAEQEPGSNIFIVRKIEEEDVNMITRVYHLKHIPLPSSRIYSTLTEFTDEEVESELEEENEFGVVKALEEILSDEGSVNQDRRTNSLVVTDYPSRFPMIEQTITRLDVRVPLVLIEAEMLDVAKDKSDLLGAKFGSTPFSFTGSERDGLWPFSLNNFAGDNGLNAPGDLDAAIESLGDPRYRVSTVSFAGLTIMLQFLRSQTDTKSLARPRILTLNHQTAQISIETDEAIGVLNTTSGADAGTQNTEQAERTPTGVFLTVTPAANTYTGEITLAVEPKVITTTASSIAGVSFRDPEERGTKSVLRVKDGDTVVIGGLLSTEVANTKTRVPFVSKVPILGSAFRHKEVREEERELLVFITPQIVKDYETPNQLQRSTDLSNNAFYREQDLASQNRQKAINSEFSYFNAR